MDTNGSSALHVAAFYGSLSVVKFLLLDYGVSPNSRNNQGRTALDIAMEAGSKDVIKVIKVWHDLVVPKSPFLHFALQHGRVQVERRY